MINSKTKFHNVPVGGAALLLLLSGHLVGLKTHKQNSFFEIWFWPEWRLGRVGVSVISIHLPGLIWSLICQNQNSVQQQIFGRCTHPISSPLSPALNWLRRAVLRRSNNERSPIRPRTDPRYEITIPSSANGVSQAHAQTTSSSSAKVLGLEGDKKQNYNPSSTSPLQHHWRGKWKKYWSS